MPCFVGCSGFSYGSWRGRFYPVDLPSKDMLTFYGKHFAAVELNVTFYRWPRPATLRSWRHKVDQHFRFSVKLHRSITHTLRLRVTASDLRRLEDLGGELQPSVVLAQLPPSLAFDPPLLEDFAATLPSGLPPVVYEARHRSFFTPQALDFFTTHGLSLAVADSGGRYPTARVVTGWPLYLRFHGPQALYASRYSSQQLAEYARWLRSVLGEGEAFAFFNNDVGGFALENALEFRQLLKTELSCPSTT